MPEPRLTVLMPVRHFDAGYLARAVDSVLAQTEPAWRLVLIDDDAGPGLGDALAHLEEDERVSVVASEPRGFAAALNTGMRHAGTEFVTVLFADDLLAPEAVATFAAAIERHPEVDVFHAARRFVDERGEPISAVYEPRASFEPADFADGPPVKHPMCWRVERALAVGGMDESLVPIAIDDYDFPWTLAQDGASFMALPGCLLLIRDHRDTFRLTTHVPLSVHVRALRRIMRKHGVSRRDANATIARAKAGYLCQCLYRSRLDRWLKQRLGHDPQRGAREAYRPVSDGRSA